MKKITKRFWVILFVVLLILLCYGLYNPLEVTHYSITDDALPSELDGYKILQISDFHSAVFGKDQQDIIKMIREEEADLILLTGDIMDKRDTDLDNVRLLLEGIEGLAPIYAVTGNHELINWEVYPELQKLYSQYNVTELDDSGVRIQHNGAWIYLYGISGEVGTKIFEGKDFSVSDCAEGCYGILMFHFDPYFDLIAEKASGYSLLFAGHSHGGIIRLPLIGPLISNEHSLFPPYAGGIFEKDGLTMVSSRGLGKAVLPRFNNRPELVSVTLRKS